MKTVRIISLSFIIAFSIASKGQPGDKFLSVGMNDTSLILSLNKQAYEFYMQSQDDSCLSSSTRALHLSEELFEFVKRSKDLKYINRCKILKAMSLKNIARGIRKTDTGRALDTLQTALLLVQEVGDKNEQASVYSLMGLTHDEAYQPAMALEFYRKSLGLYIESGNEKGQADLLLNIGITMRYMGNYGDAMENTMESLKISRQLSDSTATVEALLAMGFIYLFVEKYDDAIKAQQEALLIFEQMKDSAGIARIYNDMGVANMSAGKLEVALEQHKAALKIRLNSTDYFYTSASFSYIASIYEGLNRYPEAITNYLSALKYVLPSGSHGSIIHTYLDLGSAYMKNSEPDKAKEQFLTALELSQAENYPTAEVQASMSIARIFLEKNQPGEALAWLKKAEKNAPKPLPVFLKDLYLNIANTYSKLGDHKNAFLNLQMHSLVKDSILAAENIEKITTLSKRLEFENKLALQNENHKKTLALNHAQIKRQKITRNFSLFGMFVAFVLVGIVFVRFIEKKKLNSRLNNTLADLKATQAQLIQSEKMASLGELTAGIAHEIQNPLNFVNNFSEVSAELIAEMKQELAVGSWQLAGEIADDIKQNLEKIIIHGKRADAIVKGMLQHSRTSSGQKEPTDINALADEYLRLAYHGLRAKDKDFNATVKTDFDKAIGKISVIPQDIGRVILNLITNAFYAVDEKKKQLASDLLALSNLTGQNAYEPTVTLGTKRSLSIQGEGRGEVLISVKDNGNGIPENIREKIFQPFFTTKPTGEGTGLGLSMSYDIITKGHGGKISYNSSVDKGTEFILQIPEN
jgi:signal transduction histidine kinase